MLSFTFAHLPQGHSKRNVQIMPGDVDLHKQDGFEKAIYIYYDINKINDDIFVKTNIKTQSDLICDRCIEQFLLDIDETIDLLLTTDPQLLREENEDIYLIPEGELDINITESIRQTLLVTLPVKKLCKENCSGLCQFCGTNLNENDCNCKDEHIDPRWEALKKIKFNTNS